MKVGDKVPVTIAGQPVTQATVKEMGDGTVTLEFPATRAVMAVRTEIDAAPVTSGGTEHAILGVENRDTEGNVTTGDIATSSITEGVISTPAIPADSAAPAQPSVETPAETPTPPAPVEETSENN